MSLELSEENPYPGENVYIPQYGNGILYTYTGQRALNCASSFDWLKSIISFAYRIQIALFGIRTGLFVILTVHPVSFAHSHL